MSSWTDVSGSVPDSSTPGMLSSISCVSAVQCWAVGELGPTGGGGGQQLPAASPDRELERLIVVDGAEPERGRRSAS